MTTHTASELLASITSNRPGSFNASIAAKQILVAMLHRCYPQIWCHAFHGQANPPDNIAALHLESPDEATRIVSPQLMALLLEALVAPPLDINIRDYHVSGPNPVSVFPPCPSLREAPIGQKMPIFAHFCQDLYQKLHITKHAWFTLYLFTCLSYLHAGTDAPKAALAIYLQSINHGDKIDALMEWMSTQDRLLFSSEGQQIWQQQYKAEWNLLVTYVHVALPHRYIQQVAPLEATAESPPQSGAFSAARPPPPTPPHRTPTVLPEAPPPAPPPRTSSPPPDTGPKIIDESELEPKKSATEDESSSDSESSDTSEAATGDDELPPTSPASAKIAIDLPPIEKIAHRCKRACCHKDRLDHELLGDFVHSYGLDPKCRADHAYRLALIRLFSPNPEVRNQLIANYYMHPQELVARLDYRASACKLEKPAYRCDPHGWHGFLAAFDPVDTCEHSKLKLLKVDEFNSNVNRVSCTGEVRATATSVRIKRYLTVHYGGHQHWKPLWTHAWGAPSPAVCNYVDGYLTHHHHAHPRTLQRITYIVPAATM